MTDISYRTCTWGDLQALYDLYTVEANEVYGMFEQSLDDFHQDIAIFGFEPTTDLFGAFTADGTMVGYGDFRAVRKPPVQPRFYGYTHPDYRGQGIASQLLEMGIERAKQVIPQTPPEARVSVLFWTSLEAGKALLTNLGAVNTRQSYVMDIEFDEAPAAPQLPDGFRFATMADDATLKDIARMHHISFKDHRGSVDEPFADVYKRWQDIVNRNNHFEAELYAVVKEGDTNAGLIVVEPITEEDPSLGYINVVGVMPPYRRRGLAKQMLQFAFHELYKRGKRGASLSVDASSLTGAHKLYENAGMQVTQVYHAFEYELRAGIELSNQGQSQMITPQPAAK